MNNIKKQATSNQKNIYCKVDSLSFRPFSSPKLSIRLNAWDFSGKRSEGG